MQIRMHKILCFLLAAAAALSGMYFAYNKADASFLYMPANACDSSVESVDTAIREAQLCTTETLGVRNNADNLQLISRIISQKGTAFSFWGSLCCVIAALASGKFYTASETALFYRQYRSELVAAYIHRSDGKKRT